MKENERTCAPNYEAECERLRDIVKVLEDENRALASENQKLGLQHDELLKKSDSLEKNIRFLEGAIDAYRFCIRKER